MLAQHLNQLLQLLQRELTSKPRQTSRLLLLLLLLLLVVLVLLVVVAAIILTRAKSSSSCCHQPLSCSPSLSPL
jgi:predicted PurR-regulated permease PerM